MNFIHQEHTRNILSTWRETNIPRYGTRNYYYIGYSVKFIFRWKYDFNNRITAFFDIIGDIFPANNTTEIEQ